MLNKTTDYVASLAKGLRVIEAFGPQSPSLSIAGAAAASGLDRATARRVLLTLHREGYADYDGKFFTLTPRVLRLGVAALASLPLSQIVQPWLDQLSEQLLQSCSVALLDEGDIVYIARAAQKRVMSMGLMPGSRLPAHCTAMGRVLLAALPFDRARTLVEASDLAPRTRHSVSDLDEILRRIEQAREQGYALVDQEVELGLRSLAVPILDRTRTVVAALNVGVAVTEEPADAILQTYLPQLLKVQSALMRAL